MPAVSGGICHAGKGAVLMKFRKIVLVLLGMTFCISSAIYPALPAGAAAYNGSGTAGVNVTVTVKNADDDSAGGQIPDDDGTGDKIPGGGTGGQTPGNGGGDDAGPGQDDGGSKADTDTGEDDSNDGGNAGKDKDKGENEDKDKGKDKDKNKDKDKGKDKGSGGTQNGEEDKGAEDENGDSGKGTGGMPGQKNPSGRPAILPVPGYPAGGVPDAYPEPDRNLDDGAGASVGDGASGSINEQGQADTAESGNAGETGESGGDGDESDRDGDEPDGAGGSGSESSGFIKMALRYWKLAVLALAVSVLAVFFTRRKIRFHGILTDKDIDGVLFRRDTDSANGGAAIPELIGKLNEGGISFEEYENMVMGSRDMTLLPTGTKMDISVTDDGLAKTWIAEKADERRMYNRLGEAALLARMKGQTIKADVILKHDRKGIEIPLHFIIR